MANAVRFEGLVPGFDSWWACFFLLILHGARLGARQRCPACRWSPAPRRTPATRRTPSWRLAARQRGGETRVCERRACTSDVRVPLITSIQFKAALITSPRFLPRRSSLGSRIRGICVQTIPY